MHPEVMSLLLSLLTVSPQNGVHLLPEKKKRKTPKITVWPEFSETDVNSEKWVRSSVWQLITKLSRHFVYRVVLL